MLKIQFSKKKKETKQTRIQMNFENSKQECKQIPPFLPAWAFNFRNAFYVWFFICKEDLWGQIVQIFYFSHHWTNKTTDSHFINMLEKEHSLFYSFCFHRVGFSFSYQWNTKIMFLYRITYISMQAHKFDCSVKETLYMLCLVAQACLTLRPHGL